MMDKWARLGPGLKGKAVVAADVERDEEGGQAEESKEKAEEDAEGGISPQEYDYLLGMPMWSLTMERAAALVEEMRKSRQEREDLAKRHHHDLWRDDLDALEAVLTKHEAQEEADRVAQGAIKEQGGRKGKRGGKKAPAKQPAKGAAKDQTKKPIPKGVSNEKMIPAKGVGKKAPTPKAKDPDDMTLRERMAARGLAKEKDMPMNTGALFKASDGLTSAQQEAIVRGAGHKLAPKETTIFRELN